MFIRMTIMLVLCGIVLGGIYGFQTFGNKMMMEHFAKMGETPQTVSTTIAKQDTWQPTVKAVGTLRAMQGADLAPEVAGTVEHIFIESGQDVSEGTVLMQLGAGEELARLGSLKAQTKLARLTYERSKKQVKVGAISKAQFDSDKTALESLEAQQEESKARLEKKIVAAPFSGRLGIRQVDVGQYLNAGEAVVTLQKLDPIYFDFHVPQQRLGKIHKGQKVSLSTDSLNGKSFDGEITAINSKVDETTRNVSVRATFKNAEKLLRPGMYATAKIITDKKQSYLTLPQTAITFNPYGNTVFVVTKEGNKKIAKTSFVETGLRRGDQIAVLSGIKEGDEIVTAGQLKIRNGSIVTINNKIVPSNDANPQPKDH